MTSGRPRTKSPAWRSSDITIATRQTRLMDLVRPHLARMSTDELKELAPECGCCWQTLYHWSLGHVDCGSGRILSAVLDVLGYLDGIEPRHPPIHRRPAATASRDLH